jgi:hypothetical protein
MDEITIDRIVLRSANDKHRIRIEVTDDGSLMATLLVRNVNDPDKWEPQHSGYGTKALARTDPDHRRNAIYLR